MNIFSSRRRRLVLSLAFLVLLATGPILLALNINQVRNFFNRASAGDIASQCQSACGNPSQCLSSCKSVAPTGTDCPKLCSNVTSCVSTCIRLGNQASANSAASRGGSGGASAPSVSTCDSVCKTTASCNNYCSKKATAAQCRTICKDLSQCRQACGSLGLSNQTATQAPSSGTTSSAYSSQCSNICNPSSCLSNCAQSLPASQCGQVCASPALCQSQCSSYLAAHPPPPPANVGASIDIKSCHEKGGHYQGESFQGVRGGDNCVDITCASGCCVDNCICAHSCAPPPPVSVPGHTQEQLLNSGTLECQQAKAGNGSLAGCAGSVAWSDCITAGNSPDACQSTAQNTFEQYRSSATPAQLAFDAALNNARTAAAANHQTLSDDQLVAAAKPQAPPPTTTSTTPTTTPVPTTNPPQTYQTSCISSGQGGSPASCAGDKVWGSCKLAGGSDADCRSQAQQAYLNTEDQLKKQNQWDPSYDKYDATLDNLRGVLAHPSADQAAILKQAGIQPGQVVSDQVLLLATKAFISGKIDLTTGAPIPTADYASALAAAQVLLNPKPAPPAAATPTTTTPNLNNLSPNDVKSSCAKGGVTGGYQVFDRKNLTCYNCSPPYDKDDGCAIKAAVLCQAVALDPQSRSSCIAREKANLRNEAIPLAQIQPEQLTVQSTCSGDSLIVGSGANQQSFDCGSIANKQSPKCSMGECVSIAEAARRNSAVAVADNFCLHQGSAAGVGLGYCQGQLYTEIKAGVTYIPNPLAPNDIAIDPLQVKNKCQGYTGYAPIDGQYYDCSTGNKLPVATQVNIQTQQQNAETYCQQSTAEDVSHLTSCLENKKNAIAAGYNINPTNGTLAVSPELQAKIAAAQKAQFTQLNSQSDISDFCKTHVNKEHDTFFQYQSGGKTNSGYCLLNSPGSYVGLQTNPDGTLVANKTVPVTVYGKPADLGFGVTGIFGGLFGTNDKLQNYCDQNPYGQASLTTNNLSGGQSRIYFRCNGTKGVPPTQVDNPNVFGQNEALATSAQKAGVISTSDLNLYGAPYIRDANTIDGISDAMLKNLPTYTDAWSFGASLPDCSSTSPIRDSDQCKQFRANFKLFLAQIGAPPDSISGDCNGETGTGWWNKNQCIELANFSSFETNGGTRLARTIFNPIQVFSAPGSVEMHPGDFVTGLAGGVASGGIIAGGTLLVGGVGAAGTIAPVTGGVFLGAAIGDWINLQRKKDAVMQIMDIPCGLDGGTPLQSQYSMSCGGDINKETALAAKMQNDSQNNIFNAFKPDPSKLGGFTEKEIIDATQKAASCKQTASFDNCMGKDVLAAYQQFNNLGNEYANYLVYGGSGGGAVAKLNGEIFSAQLNTAVAATFAFVAAPLKVAGPGGNLVESSVLGQGVKALAKAPVIGPVIKGAGGAFGDIAKGIGSVIGEPLAAIGRLPLINRLGPTATDFAQGGGVIGKIRGLFAPKETIVPLPSEIVINTPSGEATLAKGSQIKIEGTNSGPGANSQGIVPRMRTIDSAATLQKNIDDVTAYLKGIKNSDHPNTVIKLTLPDGTEIKFDPFDSSQIPAIGAKPSPIAPAQPAPAQPAPPAAPTPPAQPAAAPPAAQPPGESILARVRNWWDENIAPKFERPAAPIAPPQPETFSLGRDPKAKINIDGDPTVSRSQAELTVNGDKVSITDVGSRNGTFVNGERISAPKELSPGDIVTVGKTKLQFRAIEGGEPKFDVVQPQVQPPPAPVPLKREVYVYTSGGGQHLVIDLGDDKALKQLLDQAVNDIKKLGVQGNDKLDAVAKWVSDEIDYNSALQQEVYRAGGGDAGLGQVLCNGAVCREKAFFGHLVLDQLDVKSEVWTGMVWNSSKGVFEKHAWLYIPDRDMIVDPTNFHMLPPMSRAEYVSRMRVNESEISRYSVVNQVGPVNLEYSPVNQRTQAFTNSVVDDNNLQSFSRANVGGCVFCPLKVSQVNDDLGNFNDFLKNGDVAASKIALIEARGVVSGSWGSNITLRDALRADVEEAALVLNPNTAQRELAASLAEQAAKSAGRETPEGIALLGRAENLRRAETVLSPSGEPIPIRNATLAERIDILGRKVGWAINDNGPQSLLVRALDKSNPELASAIENFDPVGVARTFAQDHIPFLPKAPIETRAPVSNFVVEILDSNQTNIAETFSTIAEMHPDGRVARQGVDAAIQEVRDGRLRYLVARDPASGRVAGYAVLEPQNGSFRNVYLADIQTADEFLNRGVASKLVTTITEQSNRVELTNVTAVSSGPEVAQGMERLYGNSGFTKPNPTEAPNHFVWQRPRLEIVLNDTSRVLSDVRGNLAARIENFHPIQTVQDWVGNTFTNIKNWAGDQLVSRLGFGGRSGNIVSPQAPGVVVVPGTSVVETTTGAVSPELMQSMDLIANSKANPISRWVDDSITVDQLLKEQQHAQPAIANYQKNLSNAVETVNKFNQSAGQPTLENNVSVNNLVADAEQILEKGYTSNINSLEYGDPGKIGPQQVLTNIFTNDKSFILPEGTRTNLEGYLQNYYKELVADGYDIKVIKASVDDVLGYLDGKARWTDTTKLIDPNGYQNFLKDIGLPPDTVSALRLQKAEISVIKINTPQGLSQEIPIINNPVRAQQVGAAGYFVSALDRSGNLEYGYISVNIGRVIDMETGGNTFVSGLQTQLHEIDHAVYQVAQDSLYAKATQTLGTMQTREAEIFAEAFNKIRLEDPALAGEYLPLHKAYEDSLIYNAPEPIKTAASNNLVQKETEILTKAFGQGDPRLTEYINLGSQIEKASIDLSTLRYTDNILDRFISEGLARKAQERFLTIVGDNVVVPGLDQSEIAGLANFVSVQVLQTRDLSGGLTLYGAGEKLIPALARNPAENGLVANAAIYEQQALKKVLLDNPDILPTVISDHLVTGSQYYLYFHPTDDPELAASLARIFIKTGVQSDNEVINYFVATGMKNFELDSGAFAKLPLVEQKLYITTLETELRSNGVSENTLSFYKTKASSDQNYYDLLLVQKYSVNAIKQVWQKALTLEYDSSSAYQKVFDAVNAETIRSTPIISIPSPQSLAARITAIVNKTFNDIKTWAGDQLVSRLGLGGRSGNIVSPQAPGGVVVPGGDVIQELNKIPIGQRLGNVVGTTEGDSSYLAAALKSRIPSQANSELMYRAISIEEFNRIQLSGKVGGEVFSGQLTPGLTQYADNVETPLSVIRTTRVDPVSGKTYGGNSTGVVIAIRRQPGMNVNLGVLETTKPINESEIVGVWEITRERDSGTGAFYSALREHVNISAQISTIPIQVTPASAVTLVASPIIPIPTIGGQNMFVVGLKYGLYYGIAHSIVPYIPSAVDAVFNALSSVVARIFSFSFPNFGGTSQSSAPLPTSTRTPNPTYTPNPAFNRRLVTPTNTPTPTNSPSPTETALAPDYPVDSPHISGYVYNQPVLDPKSGENFPHQGVDFAGNIGDPVYAIAGGLVFAEGNDKFLGKYVILKSDLDGQCEVYGHLSAFNDQLTVGVHVLQDQTLGEVGDTGDATGAHLHFGRSPSCAVASFHNDSTSRLDPCTVFPHGCPSP